MNPLSPQEKLFFFFLIHVGVTKEVGITTEMMSTSPTTDIKTSYFTVTVASTESPAATAHRDKTFTTSAAATVSHSEQGTEHPQNLTMIIEEVLTRTDPARI